MSCATFVDNHADSVGGTISSYDGTLNMDKVNMIENTSDQNYGGVWADTQQTIGESYWDPLPGTNPTDPSMNQTTANITYTNTPIHPLTCPVPEIPGDPTPTPTSIPTNTPIPTATPVATQYKYTAISDINNNRTWSNDELDQIELGVVNVGTALRLTSSQEYPTPQDAFNRIISEGQVGIGYDQVLFVRSNEINSSVEESNPDVQVEYIDNNGTISRVIYDDIDNGVCKAFAEGVFQNQPRPRAVVCNGALPNSAVNQIIGLQTGDVSQYTVVHEIGHLFDYRSGIDGGITPRIAGPLDKDGTPFPAGITFVLWSCAEGSFDPPQYAVIMGSFNNTWARGRYGWGSGPGFSVFQQNDENIPLEAAADMFLNWVYRTNSPDGVTSVMGVSSASEPDREPNNGCTPASQEFSPGPAQSWDGFKNNKWGDGNGYDWFQSGDVRFSFMNDLMLILMAQNGW